MLLQYGRSSSSLPEFAHRRIKIRDCWWLSFEHATRVLDLIRKVTVRPKSVISELLLTIIDYFPMKDDLSPLTVEEPAMAEARDVE